MAFELPQSVMQALGSLSPLASGTAGADEWVREQEHPGEGESIALASPGATSDPFFMPVAPEVSGAIWEIEVPSWAPGETLLVDWYCRPVYHPEDMGENSTAVLIVYPCWSIDGDATWQVRDNQISVVELDALLVESIGMNVRGLRAYHPLAHPGGPVIDAAIRLLAFVNTPVAAGVPWIELRATVDCPTLSVRRVTTAYTPAGAIVDVTESLGAIPWRIPPGE